MGLHLARTTPRARSVGPFPLANAGLAAWGITKNTKSRALQKLEAAGLITIEKHGHSSPWVQICSRGYAYRARYAERTVRGYGSVACSAPQVSYLFFSSFSSTYVRRQATAHEAPRP